MYVFPILAIFINDIIQMVLDMNYPTYDSSVQVNLCQKLLFLPQLTHNMTTDCSLNYQLNTWKFQAQTWGEHVVYRNCFWHSEQFLYTTCSPYVLQKEELLTKIYQYSYQKADNIWKNHKRSWELWSIWQ